MPHLLFSNSTATSSSRSLAFIGSLCHARCAAATFWLWWVVPLSDLIKSSDPPSVFNLVLHTLFIFKRLSLFLSLPLFKLYDHKLALWSCFIFCLPGLVYFLHVVPLKVFLKLNEHIKTYRQQLKLNLPFHSQAGYRSFLSLALNYEVNIIFNCLVKP